MSRFYLTTPLYYVNARPHLGHAYSTLVADTVVRFRRQLGEEAVFLTGTDEHGQKIQRAAEAAGISPRAYADAISAEFRAAWDRLGLNYSYFIRTTEPRHEAAVGEIFRRLQAGGHIYKGQYSGQYCVHDELFLNDAAPGAPCPECGRPTETVTEENYFFRLSAFQQRLLQLYRDRPEFIRPESRRNEVKAFVEGGLRDLSISRTAIHWGVPVPGDERHVLYVWFDALIGYLSGIGFGSAQPADQERFAQLWPGWHLVGKEIVRFHAVYWPAFLMAAGLPLPHGIVAHGWLLFEEEKMSKSRGNVVSAEAARQVLGADALRYFLLREVSFGHDGAFSYDALVGRYNSDLANDWGNLASRTLNMVVRYFHGRIPYPSAATAWTGADQEIMRVARAAKETLIQSFSEYQFSRGLEAVWQLIGGVNRYLVECEPWALAEKPDAESRSRLATVLHFAAESLRFSAVLLASALPETTQRLWRQLGLPGGPSLPLHGLTWGQMPVDQAVASNLGALFPRLEKAAAVDLLRQKDAAEAAETIAAPAPASPASAAPPPAPTTSAPPANEGVARIGIEDFAKVDMRVGEVKTAEKVQGADRLLRLTVDIGSEVRQIVAGIATAYAPEALIGRKVIIVANLQPRKLRGLESNGMVVAAAMGEQGAPVLVSVPAETPNGARLR
ncbi:MAG: methionine--tRNA ligase [Terriglobales bacterium]